jgi:hypothetical protein
MELSHVVAGVASMRLLLLLLLLLPPPPPPMLLLLLPGMSTDPLVVRHAAPADSISRRRLSEAKEGGLTGSRVPGQPLVRLRSDQSTAVRVLNQHLAFVRPARGSRRIVSATRRSSTAWGVEAPQENCLMGHFKSRSMHSHLIRDLLAFGLFVAFDPSTVATGIIRTAAGLRKPFSRMPYTVGKHVAEERKMMSIANGTIQIAL